MTQARWDELMEPDAECNLTPRETVQGWHFCPDWDGLLIGPGCGELRACYCLTISHPARSVPESTTLDDE